MHPPKDPYSRLTAKKISGEHCRFCGTTSAPLAKMPCCEEFICCDTAWLSNGGGRCQTEHERFSLCHFHYLEKHAGRWEECAECKKQWTPTEYKEYASHRARY